MRFAIGLEYDGSAFLGWQLQRQQPTVQGCLEKAIGRVADHEVRLHCCGRTDTGVHALCQVAHFDSPAERSERSWVLGINTHLPPAAAVLWLRRVDENFHARFSAFSRSYRYRILDRPVRPGLDAARVGWSRKPLHTGRMHQAAQYLLGEHDFSAFRASACQARHAVREVQDISVTREGQEVVIDITANGFLYHMVRNVAGSLMRIGRGDEAPDWIQHVLDSCDRSRAAPTAVASGLYFLGARYPAEYDLPGAVSDFPVRETTR